MAIWSKGYGRLTFMAITLLQINDAKYFDTHRIEAAKDPSQWPLHSEYNKAQLPSALRDMLSQTQTVAFLVDQR
jgi:hypothetical protein